MSKKRLIVTCLSCGKKNAAEVAQVGHNKFIVDLDSDHHRDPKEVNILSARYRKDGQFGWQCRCGNDSRLAHSEFNEIDKLVINGGKQAIQHITESLKFEDTQKFSVSEV